MDRDLVRIRNERNKLKVECAGMKVECAGMKDEVRRTRKRMNVYERNYNEDKERMRKRI
jgi:hypothetical protein